MGYDSQGKAFIYLPCSTAKGSLPMWGSLTAGSEACVRIPTSSKKTSLYFLVSELQLYNKIRILTPVATKQT